ncbi:hypothetical protein GGS26DRAFT_252171 [Hypomontagnella submonticulosa]|nr:hypothetical protein GGS26DRAFT_252171 [Hypomontagnella submonticulosa]
MLSPFLEVGILVARAILPPYQCKYPFAIEPHICPGSLHLPWTGAAASLSIPLSSDRLSRRIRSHLSCCPGRGRPDLQMDASDLASFIKDLYTLTASMLISLIVRNDLLASFSSPVASSTVFRLIPSVPFPCSANARHPFKPPRRLEAFLCLPQSAPVAEYNDHIHSFRSPSTHHQSFICLINLTSAYSTNIKYTCSYLTRAALD